jgi:hypothetical protein
MQTILLSREEVACRAKQLYESSIRQEIELEENIGKMVIIDIETGDYKVDENGLHAADYLIEKNPYARLFGITTLPHPWVVLWSVYLVDFRYCG